MRRLHARPPPFESAFVATRRGLLPFLFYRRLFIVFALAQLPEKAFLAEIALEYFQRLFDIVTVYLDFQNGLLLPQATADVVRVGSAAA